MTITEQNTLGQHPVWDGEPEPDVWWGPDGIDALIWADPPYTVPALDVLAGAVAPLLAGDPR